MTIRLLLWMAVVASAVSCANTGVAPEALAVGRESCAFCRMTISQADFASQVLMPGELPLFFDDLGCLHAYLTSTTPPQGGKPAVFVIDRRTKAWVPAPSAVFARVPGLATPMGSQLVAHATPASRGADTEVSGAEPVPSTTVVPEAWRARGGA